MSVNKVILLGNVGRDPEVRYFDNSNAVAKFSLATTERSYTAANGTQVPERTEWHTIVLWRGLAEITEKYVKKGSKVYVDGKIRTRSYEDAVGNKRYVTEIWADNMELLDKKTDSTMAEIPLSPLPQPPTGGQESTNTLEKSAIPKDENEEDDDLPF
jgi:single-strand DNA-binding protein